MHVNNHINMNLNALNRTGHAFPRSWLFIVLQIRALLHTGPERGLEIRERGVKRNPQRERVEREPLKWKRNTNERS